MGLGVAYFFVSPPRRGRASPRLPKAIRNGRQATVFWPPPTPIAAASTTPAARSRRWKKDRRFRPPPVTHWRRAEDRDFFLDGLRCAIGDEASSGGEIMAATYQRIAPTLEAMRRMGCPLRLTFTPRSISTDMSHLQRRCTPPWKKPSASKEARRRSSLEAALAAHEAAERDVQRFDDEADEIETPPVSATYTQFAAVMLPAEPTCPQAAAAIPFCSAPKARYFLSSQTVSTDEYLRDFSRKRLMGEALYDPNGPRTEYPDRRYNACPSVFLTPTSNRIR